MNLSWLRRSAAFGNVGSHGLDPADVFVFVELGEGFVLFDVEDQVGERSKVVPEVHEVAFEVLADEVLSADERHLSGHRGSLRCAGHQGGTGAAWSSAKFHSSRNASHSDEVVETAEDGFEHRQRVDPRIGDLDEDAGRGRREEVQDRNVEGRANVTRSSAVNSRTLLPVTDRSAWAPSLLLHSLPATTESRPGGLRLGEPRRWRSRPRLPATTWLGCPGRIYRVGFAFRHRASLSQLDDSRTGVTRL